MKNVKSDVATRISNPDSSTYVHVFNSRCHFIYLTKITKKSYIITFYLKTIKYKIIVECKYRKLYLCTHFVKGNHLSYSQFVLTLFIAFVFVLIFYVSLYIFSCSINYHKSGCSSITSPI